MSGLWCADGSRGQFSVRPYASPADKQARAVADADRRGDLCASCGVPAWRHSTARVPQAKEQR